jgi:DNA/RNA-binding domain of Phe-tRNA-synthetase-like protein
VTLTLQFTDAWRAAYPGAAVGLLAITSVRNHSPGDGLRERLRSIEDAVRARHAGRSRTDLERQPAMRPYVEHYRRFGKTYHVLLQLESVAFRGRPLAADQSLVSAMFAAEIDDLLLTAGHDLAALRPPLVAGVTRGEERYVGIGGRAIDLKPGDLSIRDDEGILSTVIHGPDQRTRLREETGSVLYTTYAPRGISDSDLEAHLHRIEVLVRADCPTAATELIATCRP